MNVKIIYISTFLCLCPLNLSFKLIIYRKRLIVKLKIVVITIIIIMIIKKIIYYCYVGLLLLSLLLKLAIACTYSWLL